MFVVTKPNIEAFERMVSVDDGPPIRVFNDIDDEGPPEGFTYIKESFPNEGVPHFDPSFTVGCSCAGNCCVDVPSHEKEAEKCVCLELNNNGYPYDSNGRLIEYRGFIYECNSRCGCGPDCRLRVVQKGRKVSMHIIRHPNGKGWGVVAGEDIPRGAFVVQYVGEIIPNEVANSRGNRTGRQSYLFDLDFNMGGGASRYTVDAHNFGNIAHFFNHSCDPNLCIMAIYIDNLDPDMHLIAFFACRDIKFGEELTFDYLGRRGRLGKENLRSPPRKNVKLSPDSIRCLCGSPNCRGYIYC